MPLDWSIFDDLEAVRRETEADQDSAWLERYGDESWNAALTVLGFPVPPPGKPVLGDTVEPSDESGTRA